MPGVHVNLFDFLSLSTHSRFSIQRVKTWFCFVVKLITIEVLDLYFVEVLILVLRVNTAYLLILIEFSEFTLIVLIGFDCF